MMSIPVSDINDFVISNGLLTAYNGNSTEVIVPEEVTEIGADVFNNNQTITRVQLPSGLIKIGTRAFKNCVNLKDSLFLPASLTEIREEAYYGCKGLSGDLTIPSGVTIIKSGAFCD